MSEGSLLICYCRVYGGGSVRSVSKTDRNRISTLRSNLGDTVKDIIVMSNDVQIGVNPCAMNNGGCAEICLFSGDHVRCQCYHARVAKDGKSCEGTSSLFTKVFVQCFSCDYSTLLDLEVLCIFLWKTFSVKLLYLDQLL